ncbi:MAG: hypothetical protein PSX81_09970 [bacterium]|nr:hypothetical protein [bacterium]
MKKIILRIIILFFSISVALTTMSFKEAISKVQISNKINIPSVESGKPKKKIRFAIRRPDDPSPGNGNPCYCPDCKIPSCPCPFGMCVVYGIADADAALNRTDSALQTEGGLGTADAWVINSGTQMVISFDQVTAYTDPNNSSNKIVNIPSNYALINSIATALGLNTVTILSGTYSAIFETSYPSGYIIVNVSTT